MSTLLALLRAFFFLGVAGDPEPDEPELDLQADDPAPGPDDPGEEDAPDGGEDPAPDKAELETLRSKAREAEEKANRYERELAEARRQQPRAQDDDAKREEAVLADPQATELQKWQIRANRELRAGRSEAQTALMQAHDVSDRTAYAALCIGDPLAKRYEERVEKKLAEFRAKGINAPREEIYTFMLGKDMREGKFKKKAAAPAAKQAEHPNLNRGRMPGARSDVSGKNAMSDREKRAKRLENVQI